MVKAQVKAEFKTKGETQEKTKDNVMHVTRTKFQKPVKQSIFDLGS